MAVIGKGTAFGGASGETQEVIHNGLSRARGCAHYKNYIITYYYIIRHHKFLADKGFLRPSAKEPQWKCEGTAMEVRRNRNGSAKEPQFKCEGNAMGLKGGGKEPQGVIHNLARFGPKCERTAMKPGVRANKTQSEPGLVRTNRNSGGFWRGSRIKWKSHAGGLSCTVGCTRRWAAPDDGYVRSLA